MAEVGLKVAWHQDSGYLKHNLPEYRGTRPRGSHVVQYTSEPVLRPDGSPFELAEPLLLWGRRVERAPAPR